MLNVDAIVNSYSKSMLMITMLYLATLANLLNQARVLFSVSLIVVH